METRYTYACTYLAVPPLHIYVEGSGIASIIYLYNQIMQYMHAVYARTAPHVNQEGGANFSLGKYMFQCKFVASHAVWISQSKLVSDEHLGFFSCV